MTAARCIAITGLETFEGRGLAERLLEDPSSPRIVALDVRLPSELEGRRYYEPGEEGHERIIRERLKSWDALRKRGTPGT